MRSAMAISLAIRSPSGSAAQDLNASRALATASSTNATVPCGHAATTLSSTGLRTLNVLLVAAALPPIVNEKSMISTSEVIAQLQAVFPGRSVDTLIAANEAREVQIVQPVPLVSGVLDERIHLPTVVQTTKPNTRVDYGVGGLEIHRSVDQLQVLLAVPLGIALNRGYAAEQGPLVAGQGVQGPMRRLWHFGGNENAGRCGNVRRHGLEVRDTELDVEPVKGDHGKFQLAAFDLGVDVFNHLGRDIQEEPLVVLVIVMEDRAVQARAAVPER